MQEAPKRIEVAVSAQRQRLREAQQRLNWHFWSSEVSYGLTLASRNEGLLEPENSLSAALSELPLSAWYRSSQGNQHYKVAVSQFKEHITQNARYLHRSILVSWYAYFEHFLEERVRALIKPDLRWGPFTQSLCVPTLTSSRYAIRPLTVALADLIRVMRNELVHQAFAPIDAIDHSALLSWRSSTVTRLASKWELDSRSAARIVERAIDSVIAHAIRAQAEAGTRGVSLPIEYFYMLYSFGNLDKLALEIEEALLPNGQHEQGRIRCWRSHVRRADLIVG